MYHCSYDESLCVWDTRYFTKGPVTSCSLGGGVWRLKYHPTKPNYVLAACMHAGFQLINTEGKKLNNFTNNSPTIDVLD